MRTSTTAVPDRLFDGLSPAVRALALRGTVRSYRKNTVLVNEGESGDATFVLLSGKVKIYSNDAYGHEIVYDIGDAGDFFAGITLDGGPRSASAMTIEASVCAVVDAPAMRLHLAPPPFAAEFLAHVT